ncbi:MAG: patatin-like phospholipase family protein [Acidobacteria bacterium]|nr:patatin-like phospholipase family protein [Acidobacteriota bacterium]
MSEISQSASLKPRRLGLALSGGGFRASFFHIGVLARLAELGLLKDVEVISTVSGGAIIGSLYYLHLKKLLENKSDNQISNNDYYEILEKIIEDFTKAVQSNIIMTAYNNPLKTLKMASSNYSSSLRLAELYEKNFYQPIFDPNKTTPIKMADLKILPKGESIDFYPLKDNSQRNVKVPILLINTTLLNTGRNWYFEATHMGEAPRESLSSQEIDKNLRLARPNSYDLLSKEHGDFPLSYAIAASAALPAVFAPIKISNLYNNIDLQLVDGGVHDNQGIEALLNFDCTNFIISDASRPLDFEANPDISNDGILLRVRSILGSRLREEQIYRMIEGEHKNHTAFIHLQKDFSIIKQSYLTTSRNNHETTPLRFISDFTLPKNNLEIAPQVQQALSHIRTHLDSFTDVEAYSLMFYGYQVSLQAILETPSLKQLITKTSNSINWKFFKIASWAKAPTFNYLQQLQVGSERFLKVFRLKPLVKKISLLVLFFIFLLIVWVIFSFLSTLLNIPELQLLLNIPLSRAISLFTPVLGFIFFLRIVFTRQYSSAKQKFFSFWARAGLPALCFPLVWLHLFFYDQLFLNLGQLDQLEKPISPTDLSSPINADQQLESQ